MRTVSLLLALCCSLPTLTAQVPSTQEPSAQVAPTPTARRQPVDPDFQQQVDSVFGDIIAGLQKYPFYNIAPLLGYSEDPQPIYGEQDQLIVQSRVLAALQGAVATASFSPSGKHVLAVAADNTVHVYELDGTEVVALPHTAAVHDAAIYPDEAKFSDKGEILTAAADGVVRIFNAKGEEQLTLRGHEGVVHRAVYSEKGRWIATAGADGTVRIWDARGAEVSRLEGHTDGAREVKFAPGNEHIASVDGGGTLRVWWLSTGDDGMLLAAPMEGFALQGVTRFSWSAEGGVLGAMNDTSVAHWRVSAREVRERGDSDLGGKPVAFFEVLQSEDRSAIRYYGADGAETVLASGAWPEPVATGDAKVSLEDLRALAGGMRVAAAEGANTGSLASLDGSRSYQLTGHSGALTVIEFAADGQRLLTAGAGGKVILRDWLQRGPDGGVVVIDIPFVVLWLVFAAVFFTLFMRFVNFRMFKHAIACVAGKFSDPNDQGEVSHFQALSAALSATVGLGNIAGVAIAVSIGGPGATFWMIIAGLLGMTLKFTECTLGQKFRKIDDQGRVSGGPMHYLADGLRGMHLGIIGVPLAMVFTVFCIGGSLAGGNAFQVNQSLGILKGQVPFFQEYSWVYGVVMAALVGIVIIGGIRRIAHTAETIVPTMCTIYVLSALVIIVTHLPEVPAALGNIFSSALTGDAVYGGAIGALIQGFRRAAFSNEAGVGSAAIAHSAARTPYPVREGIVALLEPFIDTVVVCTMTALVIGITGVYQAPEHFDLIAGKDGAALTAEAFKSVSLFADWFPWLLMAAVILFAFSTMISWSYYGERCWTNLFGPRSSLYYKLLFLLFVVLGSIVQAKNVLEFGDLMILLMAFPNIFGLYFLARIVRRELKDYEGKIDSGEIRPFK